MATRQQHVHIAAAGARLVGLHGDPAVRAEVERLAATPTGVHLLDQALADAAATLNWRALMAKELST